MATGTIIPSPIFTGLDTNGDPVNGGKLYTYSAGTTTAQTTYSDVNLTVANANPIVLDSAGRATVFVTTGSSFKYVLTDSADVTLWTADNIGAVPKSTATLDVTVTAGEDISALEACYISQGDGSKTTGRAYLTDADETYSSSLAITIGLAPSDITSGETGSIRLGGSLGGYTGLTAGSTQYVSATAGALTESAPSNVKIVGQATSTTSVMMAATVSQIDASQITSGTLAVARGGTGIASYSTNDFLRATGSTTLAATAATAVFPYVSPLTTRGDTLIGTSGVVTGTRLGVGGADTFLSSDGTDVSWAAVSTVATVLSKTTTYTITDANGKDVLVKADTSGGAWTLTLLAAATAAAGAKVVVTKTTADVNALTIDGNGSETINGNLTATLPWFDESITLVCDGSNWVIVSQTPKSIHYPVTIAKVENSTSETTIFQWTMPANQFNQGDMLYIRTAATGRNYSGSTSTINWDLSWDTSGDGGADEEFDLCDISVANNSTTSQGALTLKLARGLDATNTGLICYFADADMNWNSYYTWTRNTTSYYVSNASCDFTKDAVVSLKATLGAAHAQLYIVPWSCVVILERGSTGGLS